MLWDVFSFLTGAASVVGLVLTYKALREARAAQNAAERAQQEAEDIRSRYARKQRLPQLREQIDALTDRLDADLNAFDDAQDYAREKTGQIVRMVAVVVPFLDGENKSEVENLGRDIQRRVDLLTAAHGREVRGKAREVVLILDLVIDNERAKAL